ncbi:hypothetical protein [Bradyrhizobium sp. CCBAU 53421]|uniref:hypothetical protein n=1 Tax=Bradyrhizobium sp. CCBAU 53421 TaxID=1325120 RepID=UPI00188AC920|nr:hypothetical protein [Bradyrhizobium sp. CCBAU 53421]QOZ37215.1 hypothetical protein XH92_41390 [Bradyrhizobium sp. CCBAU 53421]
MQTAAPASEAASQQAARSAASRTRKRLALLLRSGSTGAARLGKARPAIVTGKAKTTRGRAVRVASRARSSS